MTIPREELASHFLSEMRSAMGPPKLFYELSMFAFPLFLLTDILFQ